MSRNVQEQIDVLALIAGGALGIAILTYFYTVFGAVIGFTPTSGSLFYFPSWIPVIGGMGPIHHEVWGAAGMVLGAIMAYPKNHPVVRMLGFAVFSASLAAVLDDYYLHCLSQPYGACVNWP